MATFVTYHKIELGNGNECLFIIPTGREYSKAVKSYSLQQEFDMMPFFMEQICRINGEPKGVEYFVSLGCDDYIKVMNIINDIATPIK